MSLLVCIGALLTPSRVFPQTGLTFTDDCGCHRIHISGFITNLNAMNEGAASGGIGRTAPADLPENTMQAVDSTIPRAYGEIGFVLGTPALYNFSAGFWSGIVGLRLSGGIWGETLQGIQLNAGVKFHDSRLVRLDLALLLGSYLIRTRWGKGFFQLPLQAQGEWFGLVSEMYLGGFFMQLGWITSIGGCTGAHCGDTVALQLGGLFRFL